MEAHSFVAYLKFYQFSLDISTLFFPFPALKRSAEDWLQLFSL